MELDEKKLARLLAARDLADLSESGLRPEAPAQPAQINVNLSKREDFEAAKRRLGAQNHELAGCLLHQSAGTLPTNLPSNLDITELLSALPGAIQPKDEFEALLVTQMTATHCLAMKNLALANSNQAPHERVSAYIERANKLLRTYVAQVEALNRHRGKGQQKVTVEHVTVNQGGQAMIGTVERPGGGPGA